MSIDTYLCVKDMSLTPTEPLANPSCEALHILGMEMASRVAENKRKSSHLQEEVASMRQKRRLNGNGPRICTRFSADAHTCHE